MTIDESQFGFFPGRGTTDAIFVVHQLQEKYLALGKQIYMAFFDLKKAFDRVPQKELGKGTWKVTWWAIRKIGVKEWIVKLGQETYENVQSRVRLVRVSVRGLR